MSVTPVHVLIVFYSRSGLTEKLALAAAVGAVQARANIRIRRLPSGEESVAHRELKRMRREYVSPTPADSMWADAVIIGMNGKIAGLTLEPDAATTYGRQAAAATRALKYPEASG